MSTLVILRAVLVVVMVSHVVLGAIAFVAVPDVVTSLAAMMYGATFTLTPQLQHAIRIVGAFMVAIGIMAFFALRDPVRNRAIVDAIGILQLLRVSQRVLFATDIQQAFAIPTGRLWAQGAFFLVLGLALLLLRPRPVGRRT